MLIIMKFGGSSLKDNDCIRMAASRITWELSLGNQVVAVVSAQGDTTDDLTQKAAGITPCPDPRELDMLLSTGEQASASLMALAVRALGYSAVSLTGWQAGLHTDGNHTDAKVSHLEGHRITDHLQKKTAVIVAGFQGVSPCGDITTLGRGGSDTTAVALAAFLQADECRIYTDVDGIYDKDPRKFSDGKKFEVIDYKTMLNMARQGAQVLHDRSVELAMTHHIPIRVLSTFCPGPGTLVTDTL